MTEQLAHYEEVENHLSEISERSMGRLAMDDLRGNMERVHVAVGLEEPDAAEQRGRLPITEVDMPVANSVLRMAAEAMNEAHGELSERKMGRLTQLNPAAASVLAKRALGRLREGDDAETELLATLATASLVTFGKDNPLDPLVKAGYGGQLMEAARQAQELGLCVVGNGSEPSVDPVWRRVEVYRTAAELADGKLYDLRDGAEGFGRKLTDEEYAQKVHESYADKAQLAVPGMVREYRQKPEEFNGRRAELLADKAMRAPNLNPNVISGIKEIAPDYFESQAWKSLADQHRRFRRPGDDSDVSSASDRAIALMARVGSSAYDGIVGDLVTDRVEEERTSAEALLVASPEATAAVGKIVAISEARAAQYQTAREELVRSRELGYYDELIETVEAYGADRLATLQAVAKAYEACKDAGVYEVLGNEPAVEFLAKSALIRMHESPDPDKIARNLLLLSSGLRQGGAIEDWSSRAALAGVLTEKAPATQKYVVEEVVTSLPVAWNSGQTEASSAVQTKRIDEMTPEELQFYAPGASLDGDKTPTSIPFRELAPEFQEALFTARIYAVEAISNDPSALKAASERNRLEAEAGRDVLEEGSLTHSTNAMTLRDMVRTGLLCTEAVGLGGIEREDTYPYGFDTFAVTGSEGKTFEAVLNEMGGGEFGAVTLVMRRHPGDTDYGHEYDPNPSDSGYGDRHRIVFGGMPFTEVSAIILDRDMAGAEGSVEDFVRESRMFMPIYDKKGERLLDLEAGYRV